ncbi:tyrosine-protein phosphatase [Phocaeicola plebeius]|uniref:tyrosine-protein phosphatase n=1 Tax=Phocaeicola plebeius TaxID=310297 RepID=UPI003569C7F3
MWSLFSRETIAESDILKGVTDYHSHILPGVDDGVMTTEEAFELLSVYEELGIRTIWLTPHVMEDYPNKTDILRERFKSFSICYNQYSQNPVTLCLASENMVDSLFMHRLGKEDLLPIIDSKHLLIETSCYIPPFNFTKLLEQIIHKGYIPVLAHPERYCYLSAMQEYEELHHAGVRLQLDMASIVGAYGEDVRCKALALLQKGYYSLIGTDTHHLESFMKWINIPVKKTVLKSLRYIMNE